MHNTTHCCRWVACIMCSHCARCHAHYAHTVVSPRAGHACPPGQSRHQGPCRDTKPPAMPRPGHDPKTARRCRDTKKCVVTPLQPIVGLSDRDTRSRVATPQPLTCVTLQPPCHEVKGRVAIPQQLPYHDMKIMS